MGETADDLSTPLGQETARRKRRYRIPFTGMQALAVLLGLFLAAFAGFAIFNDNPLGGEPIKRMALSQAIPGDKPASPATTEPDAKPVTDQNKIGGNLPQPITPTPVNTATSVDELTKKS